MGGVGEQQDTVGAQCCRASNHMQLGGHGGLQGWRGDGWAVAHSGYSVHDMVVANKNNLGLVSDATGRVLWHVLVSGWHVTPTVS
jgi:hypothetical protein